MANRYKIYPEKHFAISILEQGEKTFNELFQMAKEFREDEHFSSVHYQLSDLRGCSFNFNQSEVSPLIELIKSYKETDNQKIGVYMVDKPLETAIVHLFFKEIDSVRKYCSTIEKAYHLLSLPIPYDEFSELIEI